MLSSASIYVPFKTKSAQSGRVFPFRAECHSRLPAQFIFKRIFSNCADGIISSGYGTGSELLQIKKEDDGKWLASGIWKSIRLKAKFTNVVVRDGFIYGLDDGILVCLDASDGSLKWKEGRYGHGQVILSGSLLLVTDENGDVVLVEPVPREHRELTRFPALHGKTWNPPALAGEFLIVRNDKEAACYRLPLAKPQL